MVAGARCFWCCYSRWCLQQKRSLIVWITITNWEFTIVKYFGSCCQIQVGEIQKNSQDFQAIFCFMAYNPFSGSGKRASVLCSAIIEVQISIPTAHLGSDQSRQTPGILPLKKIPSTRLYAGKGRTGYRSARDRAEWQRPRSRPERRCPIICLF